MRTHERVTLAVAFAITAAAAILIVASYLGIAPSDRKFDQQFAHVRPGMHEREVIQRLGDPDERTPSFRLGQYRGNEAQYAGAARSGCSDYLVWRRSGHMTYVVGINSEHRVCYTASGGT